MIQQLNREMGGPFAPVVDMSSVIRRTVEATVDAISPLQAAEIPVEVPEHAELSIVSQRSRPPKWHHIGCMVGPLES